LFDEDLPDEFLFGFCEDGLFGLELARVVADFDVDNAFHHVLYSPEVILSPLDFFVRHLEQ
jgi:hypothetical protein